MWKTINFAPCLSLPWLQFMVYNCNEKQYLPKYMFINTDPIDLKVIFVPEKCSFIEKFPEEKND